MTATKGRIRKVAEWFKVTTNVFGVGSSTIHPEDQRFESFPSECHILSPVAQLVEQRPVKPLVPGSSPGWGAIRFEDV